MKKEWLLLVSIVVVTTAIVLAIVRWLAPGLLGISIDLQMVQVAKEVPPFFDNVFREEDHQTDEFLINDPLTGIRAKPLFVGQSGIRGPHDLLGFRNNGIPNHADVVVLGDSQTYGNNAVLEQNWPSQMRPFFAPKRAVVYSMAVGGWGGVQYLDMFDKAKVFQPRVVVVAFHTGNDPLETLLLTYSVDKWSFLRPGPQPSDEGFAGASWPPPKSEWWPVRFRDGVKTIFTPILRYTSNQDHPKVHTGYKIMARVAELISKKAAESSTRVAFTIIPTKELVFLRKIQQDGLEPIQDYLNLVAAEAGNIERLADSIRSLPGAIYVDVVKPLQNAALGPVNLYMKGPDGHPMPAGYRVIARAVARQIEPFLPQPSRGLVALQLGKKRFQLLVLTERGYWTFAARELVQANGWDDGEVHAVQRRDIEGLPTLGTIDEVDPARFGPAAFP